MQTSRQRLLAYIRSREVVTAAELSRALKMTPANARHHLSILEQEGLVEAAGDRPRKGRGRPAKVYRLSEGALGHNLDRLAGILLEKMLENRSPAERATALREIAERLKGTEGDKPGSLSGRLYSTIQRLNEMNYAARWEAHAESPQIILGHCPYASILPEHPELCRMDAALLEALLGVPVQQTARMATDLRGAKYCRFHVET